MVKALVSELNKSQIQYAVTGAIAASYCGSPRSTTDVDFIVKVSPRNSSVSYAYSKRPGSTRTRSASKRSPVRL
ncbi:hypothetical protein AUG19_08065 [archaeon 13_1_20CM_2_54_9]|nr:MAG: hypothetical protein AUJ07_04160 [Crenarchaeota archaeon 13_1_40CM_3_53_5]OLE74681.1 MAG: hypothetical protein AUG19_08065 [archaeon 13_1_20CM_2_54_9]